MGRLLRSPEGHEDGDPPIGDPPVTVPPGEPPAPPPPADPPEPPAEPVPPPEPLTPESLALPEGMELKEEISTKYLEILNGDATPQDRANALLALHGEVLRNAQEADSEAWDNMQVEWRNEVKADPEIGGDKLKPALDNIGKLVSEFGSQELKNVFDATGAGNNVHVIKFLNSIASKLTEGNFFTGGQPTTVVNSEEARAQRMYPSMNK